MPALPAGLPVERAGPGDAGVEDGPGPFESQPARRLQQMRQALGPAHQALGRMRRVEERLIEQSEEPDHPPVGTGLNGIAGALGLLAERINRCEALDAESGMA